MYISNDKVRHYLSGALVLMQGEESIGMKDLHKNMLLLEKVSNELNFYEGIVVDLNLKELIGNVKEIVLYYLNHRYVILKDRKTKKCISKKLKAVKSIIDDFVVVDSNIDMPYINQSIKTVLTEISEGMSIRNYDSIIDRYELLYSNLNSLSNIVESMDNIDDELHFLNTFIDSKYIYLAVEKQRGNLKRIAESLLKNIC